jgi:protein-S-isoprenylcysteine O-methyltransferase Ste14
MEKKERTKLILQTLMFVIILLFSIYRTYSGVVAHSTKHIIISGTGVVLSIVGIYIMLSPLIKKNKNKDFFN